MRTRFPEKAIWETNGMCRPEKEVSPDAELGNLLWVLCQINPCEIPSNPYCKALHRSRSISCDDMDPSAQGRHIPNELFLESLNIPTALQHPIQ